MRPTEGPRRDRPGATAWIGIGLLAAVLTGRGGAGLLDSYEGERRPCAVLEREALLRSLAGPLRDIQPRTT